MEAQGSGTPVGDLIELRALENVFGKSPRTGRPVLVGSAHSNIGHTAWAGGMAGVIKTILQLHHRQIVPTANFRATNPRLARRLKAIEVAAELQPWSDERAPLRAGVSSFGVSGTNAHVILEEAPVSSSAEEPAAQPNPYQLFTLSGRSEDALRRLARKYAEHLQTDSPPLESLCWQLLEERTHFPHRLAAVVDSLPDLVRLLTAYGRGPATPGVVEAEAQPDASVAFLCGGVGPQFQMMGRELFQTQPVFAAAVRECDAILGDQLPARLLDVLYPERGRTRLLFEPAFAHPLLFTISHALAQMWLSWGVKPDVVIGHDVGEFVAARLAGVLSLEDALRLATAHGQYFQAQATGKAARTEALAKAARDFEAVLGKCRLNQPGIRLVAVREKPLILNDLDIGKHWSEMLAPNAPPDFAQVAANLETAGPTLFLEVSPGAALSNALREESICPGFWWHTLEEQAPPWKTVMQAAAALHLHGVILDWQTVTPSRGRQRLRLPGYEFERRRHWLESHEPGAVVRGGFQDVLGENPQPVL